MARVVIHLQNQEYAYLMEHILEENGDFNVTVVTKPENLISEFNRVAANMVILGVTNNLVQRLELAKFIKKTDYTCKVVLAVNERKNPRVAEKVVQAKIDGLIDQFIYSSISETYFVAVMTAL